MDERPTRRWLVTRFELAVGATCSVLGPMLVFIAPPSRVMRFSEPSVMGIPLADAFLAMGFLGLATGMLWMLRIARRGPEDGRPSIWRYR